jgi:hypothetical protein
MPDILILVAHPHGALAREPRGWHAAGRRPAQGPGGPRIQVRDLYALYPTT